MGRNFSLSQTVIVLAFALLENPCACKADVVEPIVIFDGWWAVDHAKNLCADAQQWERENRESVARAGCANVDSCPEKTPRLDACRFDIIGGFGSFQNELATRFVSDPSCNTIRYVIFEGPDVLPSEDLITSSAQPHWALIVNFIPGAGKQFWSLVHGLTVHQGEGTPREIATKACAIARAAG